MKIFYKLVPIVNVNLTAKNTFSRCYIVKLTFILSAETFVNINIFSKYRVVDSLLPPPLSLNVLGF